MPQSLHSLWPRRRKGFAAWTHVLFKEHLTALRSIFDHRSASEIKSANVLQVYIPFLRAAWLFTYSDLKTIVGPQTTFGILYAMCLSILTQEHIALSSDHAMCRALLVLLWVWINLLPFTIGNQLQTKAIEEDRLNKPWRPLPSGLLTCNQAAVFMTAAYPVAFVISILAGGTLQCLTLVVLGVCYNGLGGADHHFLVRNLLIAVGYLGFASGALEVAIGYYIPWSSRLVAWFCVIGLVVFSTVHVLDMYDQAGDRQRDRRTLPLMRGDAFARWTITVLVPWWSGFVWWYYKLDFRGGSILVVPSLFVAGRTLTLRSSAADRLTATIWNCWIIALYLAPLFWQNPTFDVW